jgi:riboflavin kinase/FMN adenylyltransferase
VRSITDIRLLKRARLPISMAVGFFDGVHRGHQKVIRQAALSARETGGKSWALTFEPHPLKILNPPSAPLLLTANQHRLRLLGRLGLDGCLVLPFTRDLARQAPEAFVDFLLGAVPALKEIHVGVNWRFGRNGKGNTGLLARLGRKRGIRVSAAGPVVHRGETISSTRIRSEVLRGNLDEAAAMLGRPFSVLGSVVRGRTVGRKLGYPTANLDVHNEVLPPHGVYAAHVLLGRKLLAGVLSFGSRPTFQADGPGEPLLEVHVFNFDGSLYGHDLEIFFVAKIRQEQAFGSAEALKRQIREDCSQARGVLAAKKLKETLYTVCRPVL